MLRCLIRSFQLSFAFHPSLTKINLTLNHQRYYLKQLQLSRQFHTENFASRSFEIEEYNNNTPGPLDGENEAEYIVPYNIEHEQHVPKTVLVGALAAKLHLTNSEIMHIIHDENFCRNFKETKQRSQLPTIDILIAEGVKKRCFLDYPWLITIEKIRLKEKLWLLRTMPIRDINHFVPFLQLSVPRLKKIVNLLNRESKFVPESNRIYYVSKLLDVDPYIVSKYLSRRLFTLEMPFNQFDINLHHMIDYQVSPLNMLRDLWAFRYTPKAIKLRFERASKAKKGKIMPWMVRCPETILQRSLKLTLDEKAVLGKRTSVVEYVADRLQFDVVYTKAIMQKHPNVFRVRVTKIKEVLDYLLDEAGFTSFEISQNPRILCHSLETTKTRINELKSYGCRPSTLVIVCRSKREYEKFVQKWLSTERINTTTVGGENVAEKKHDTTTLV